MVEYFLERFTVAKDTIFDPFAGFGTTFLVAEAMNRIPYGIEYNEKRYEYVKSIVSHRTNIIHGDALKLLSYDFPKINFSITSPPYMTKTDHPEFPLTPPKALMNNI